MSDVLGFFGPIILGLVGIPVLFAGLVIGLLAYLNRDRTGR